MDDEILDIDDEKFEQMLADKQHKQLMVALRELIGTIKKSENNDGKMLQTISDNNSSINTSINVFLDKVKDLSKPQTISVNAPSVNINQDEVVKELKLVVEELKNKNLPNEKEEWEFKIVRGYSGNIDKVIATKQL